MDVWRLPNHVSNRLDACRVSFFRRIAASRVRADRTDDLREGRRWAIPARPLPGSVLLIGTSRPGGLATVPYYVKSLHGQFSHRGRHGALELA